MLVFFLGAAAVQYNDPNPVIWVSVYGTAAGCCFLTLIGRLPGILAIILCGAYVLGALFLLGQVLGPIGFLDPSGQAMMGITEQGRETLGLLIAALWTGFLGSWVQGQQLASRGVISSRGPANETE